MPERKLQLTNATYAIGLDRRSTAQSLSGHQSAVECVSFDSAEEVVVAGASGGTVKLWDLEQAKGTQSTNTA